MIDQEIIKTIKKVVLLGLPIIAIIIYLEINLYKIPNTYNTKRVYFEQNMDKVETLVLGSSHALNAVNPAFLDKKAFNMANTSQTLYYDAALTTQYLDKMPQLKTVCINLSYFSFFAQLEDGTEAWRTLYYYYFWQIQCDYTYKLDLRKYSLMALYGNNTTLKYLSNNWKINEAPLLRSNGFMPKDTANKYVINDQTGYERCVAHQNEKVNYRRKEIENRLSLFIDLLRHKRGIHVILFTTPVYKTYSQYLNKSDVEENNLIIKTLCDKYKINYYNYADDSRFLITDFANNDHLNLDGAAKFSKIFNAEALNNDK
jgi:hypothetical protein